MIDMEIDHIGLLVKNIEKELSIYEKLGYTKIGKIFQDNNQMMRGQFLKPLKGDGYLIELIEDLSDSKSLQKILNSQNGKIYHLAFKVENLEKNIDEILKQLNGRVLSPIKNGEYFKKVCFIFLQNAQIIELVEHK